MNIVPLETEKHNNLHFKTDHFYGHMKNQHIVPVIAPEMAQVAISFPIVFIKQQDSGQFKMTAMMGLEPGENLVFTGSEVNATYIPVNVRRYPFFIGTGADKDPANGVLCIDESADNFSTEEGERLFDDENKPTQIVENATNLIKDLMQGELATDKFIEYLVEKNLIHSSDLTLRMGDGEDKNIQGIYKVNEEALDKIDDETLIELHKRHYLGAIYTHLNSLQQINRLLHLKSSSQIA